MKVFIFGAGASLGSQKYASPNDFAVAPLVDRLFAPQYHQFATGVLADDEIEDCRNGIKQTSSLEQWLTKRWENVDHFAQNTKQYSERAFFGKVAFYLWYLLKTVSSTYNDQNGYSIFLKRLVSKDEPFGLISFNYDTLLDQAVQSRMGTNLLSLDDYKSIGYIKPHGSINWCISRRPEDFLFTLEGTHDDVARTRVAASRLYNGSPLRVESLNVIDPQHVDMNSFHGVVMRFNGQYFYPVLFMPLTTKLYATLAGFSERVIAEGQGLLNRTSEIYLIGYRANDEIIKEMFRAAKPGTKLNIVDKNNSLAVFDSVNTWAYNLKPGTFLDSGFMDFAEHY